METAWDRCTVGRHIKSEGDGAESERLSLMLRQDGHPAESSEPEQLEVLGKIEA
jgi:hypothetical protein